MLCFFADYPEYAQYQAGYDNAAVKYETEDEKKFVVGLPIPPSERDADSQNGDTAYDSYEEGEAY